MKWQLWWSGDRRVVYPTLQPAARFFWEKTWVQSKCEWGTGKLNLLLVRGFLSHYGTFRSTLFSIIFVMSFQVGGPASWLTPKVSPSGLIILESSLNSLHLDSFGGDLDLQVWVLNILSQVRSNFSQIHFFVDQIPTSCTFITWIFYGHIANISSAYKKTCPNNKTPCPSPRSPKPLQFQVAF